MLFIFPRGVPCADWLGFEFFLLPTHPVATGNKGPLASVAELKGLPPANTSWQKAQLPTEGGWLVCLRNQPPTTGFRFSRCFPFTTKKGVPAPLPPQKKGRPISNCHCHPTKKGARQVYKQFPLPLSKDGVARDGHEPSQHQKGRAQLYSASLTASSSKPCCSSQASIAPNILSRRYPLD